MLQVYTFNEVLGIIQRLLIFLCIVNMTVRSIALYSFELLLRVEKNCQVILLWAGIHSMLSVVGLLYETKQ
jgi:hypothetical protein